MLERSKSYVWGRCTISQNAAHQPIIARGSIILDSHEIFRVIIDEPDEARSLGIDNTENRTLHIRGYNTE